MTTPTEVLQQFAHRLQLAAPREWDAFLQCLDAYATEITVAVISAEQNEILVRQGSARMAIHLLQSFRTCGNPRPQPQPVPQPPQP